MIGRVNSGGGTVRIQAKNYTVLPATGKQNDIAIINGQTVTDTIISPDEPSTLSEGMVWICVAKGGRAFLTIGNSVVPLTSAKQYVANAWVTLGEWYVFCNDEWKRGRLYFIENSKLTGAGNFSTKSYGAGGSFSYTSDPFEIRNRYPYPGSYQTNGPNGIESEPSQYACFSTMTARWKCQGSNGGVHDAFISLKKVGTAPASAEFCKFNRANFGYITDTSVITHSSELATLFIGCRTYTYLGGDNNYSYLDCTELYLE